MTGIIYHVYDVKTGLSYIGQTWGTLDLRKRSHLRASNKSKSFFCSALRKRPEDFIWSILVQFSTQEELDRAEDYFIIDLKTLYPNGYNLKRGGSRGRHSELSKQRMRDACRARLPISEKTREKLRVASSGKSFGQRSEEIKRKISETLKKKKYQPTQEAREKMSVAARKALAEKKRDQKGKFIK